MVVQESEGEGGGPEGRVYYPLKIEPGKKLYCYCILPLFVLLGEVGCYCVRDNQNKQKVDRDI